ncbi:unnamed protein product [Oncorhynchus mykiss]|uniref:Triacylglycerol lipase n=1 Tax=Oncorhynchus mykiss TaxID=8022 RepID=A0A060X0Q0_ONCMY|nr:unnamed protein product [Oncorhynchus mykiss]
MCKTILTEEEVNCICVDWKKGGELSHTANRAFSVERQHYHSNAHPNTFCHRMSTGRRLAWSTLSDSLGAHTAGEDQQARTRHRAGPSTALLPGPHCHGSLESSNATFVDVIHTDTLPFISYVDKGISQAVGHIDFYPNGGEHMPGCDKNIVSTIVDIDSIWEGEN